MALAINLCSKALSTGIRLWARIPFNRSFHAMAKPNLQLNAMSFQRTSGIELLAPETTILSQVAGFKVKGRLRRRCKDCLYVIRHQRHYIICPTHGRHKQMSMKKKDYKSWILTHATQSKIRPY